MKRMRSHPRMMAVLSFILCLPATPIFLFNLVRVAQDFWPLAYE